MPAMMTSRNSSFRRSAGRVGLSRRKRYSWRVFGANLTTVGLGTGQLVLLNQGDLSELTEPTLIRTRGTLTLSTDSLAGVQQFVVALAVVQLDELGNPPAVNAFDQERGSYFWFHAGTLQDYGGGHRYYRVEIDAKAKRRIEGDEGVVLYVQQITGSSFVDYRLMGRILLQQV